MIQRIQTLFLMGVIVAYACMYFFPLVYVEGQVEIYISGIKLINPQFNVAATSTWLLIFNNVLVIALTALIIALYQNRLLQLKLCRSAVLLSIVMLLLGFFVSDEVVKNSPIKHSYGVAIIMPIVALILVLLAIRAIKKDEEKVHSADRLR